MPHVRGSLCAGQRQELAYHALRTTSDPPLMRMACSRSVIVFVFGSAALLFAVEPTPQKGASVSGAIIVARVQEDLRAANEARSRHGAEIQAWHLEQERLATAINGLQAEITRGEQELAIAEAQRAILRAEQMERGSGEIPLAQQVLAEAARATRRRLLEVAATVPPGTVVIPADDGFDAVLKALEATDRAASQVVVDISAGHLAGTPSTVRTAVRLLRIGSLAWWTSLDGANGGTVSMVEGRVELQVAADVDDRAAIRHAVAMVEGRKAAEPLALPLGSSVSPVLRVPAVGGGAP